MDSVSEARLQLVWPLVADKFHTMDRMLEPEGIEIRLTQGLRSWQEQDALYAQGRTVPGVPCNHHGVIRPIGTCSEHPLGVRVTNCRGGYSYHNFGMAGDAVPSQFHPDQPYSPDWNPSHASWKRMEAVGLSLGFSVGAMWRTFPDAPHFQLTGRFPEGEPDDEVRQLFKDGGMQAIWAEAGLTSSS